LSYHQVIEADLKMMTSIYYSDTPDGVAKQTTTYPLEETDEYFKYSYAKIVLNESTSGTTIKKLWH
jgi:hypothetical protein